MRYLRFLFLYTLLYIGGVTHAFRADSVEVSLLTCSPGTEVYSLYGHTAIRVKSYTTAEDWVFNYGVFSFNIRILYGALREASVIIRLEPCLLLTLPRNMKSAGRPSISKC